MKENDHMDRIDFEKVLKEHNTDSAVKKLKDN